MGTFHEQIEVSASEHGPFEAIEALVDSGATYTSLPAAVLERLGVQPIDVETFIMADGTRHERRVGEAVIRVEGRSRTSMVIFGDDDSLPLMGAITLEAFSLAIDMRNRRLVRVPGYLTAYRSELTVRDAIAKLVDRRDLTEDEASACMDELMSGGATPSQTAALLVALRMKGETVEEITGLARKMREKSLHVEADGPLLDTCGTGGDASGTFNVSTAAAFVGAGAGARVAKHGNRAMSSECGSADVLEALGGKIDLPPDCVAKCIDESNFGFMFAQVYHPSMKHVAPVRREIGIRTVFNVLGPLTNPARAQHQVIGAPSVEAAEKLASVLARLGTEHSLVVHGDDGLDELSVCASTTMFEVQDAAIVRRSLAPSDLGLRSHEALALKGGSPEDNAAALRRVLAGEAGALRDFTLINAAAALVAANLAPDMKVGLAKAARSIDSGAAGKKLETWVRVSNTM
jgi:anthranilate phosphoribosyltransferase